MESLVLILVFVVIWAWIEIYRSKQAYREQTAALVHRVYTLETQMANLHQNLAVEPEVPRAPVRVPEPAVHTAPPPMPAMPGFTPVPPAPVAPATAPVPHMPPPVPVFAASTVAADAGTVPPPLTQAPPPPPRVTEPSFLEQLRGKDWESLIGGNLLNKIGALLLVIGIMSFLAYYGTRMGPAGRAGCSVLVSLSLLGFGIWLERRETYRMIARSLIGAGWAALYATAYAVYALPAARIIENPFVGSFLVLLVAAGMIAHSLRYHAQGVTAVAFFSAFAALSVTPSTTVAVLSLIPLAAAVLYLAQRFDWYHMALMGVFATYGACAWRGASGAPLLESETLFILYWVLFEVFDLMRFSRGSRGWAVELIFPLNAAGFLGLSYASWTSKSPESMWVLSAIAASIYAVSALWRLKIEIDRGFDQDQVLTLATIADRVRAGTYEAPLVLAAFLTATAIVQKLTGLWMSTALAMEAQALFTAGIRFRSRLLRALATIGFLFTLGHIASEVRESDMVNVLGHMTHTWVILVLFVALLLYVNRAMSEPKSLIGIGYSWVGALLVACAIGAEIPVYLVGCGWLVLAAILFELGVRKQWSEFRFQSYVMAFVGAMHSLAFFQQAPEYPWLPLAFGAAFTYAAACRVGVMERGDPANREWGLVGWGACGFTPIFASVLLIKQVPDAYAGAALWGLSLVMLELGLQRLPSRMRIFAYPVAALASLASFGEAPHWVKFAGPQVWVTCFVAAAVAWMMSVRLTLAAADAASGAERGMVRSILSTVGLLFGLIALWMVVPDEFLPATWAVLGVAALEAGKVLQVQAYRLQGHAVAGYAALSAFGLTLPEGHTHRVLAIAFLIAVHIGFRLLSDVRPGPEGKLPVLHESAATILAAALIFQEVSGSLLTMAWGGEALALMGAGFAFRERPLRLQGLGLFLLCVLKLFLYDLRNLDTPYRILSFIALGLILLGVSWIYTRFREQLQKLL